MEIWIPEKSRMKGTRKYGYQGRVG